MKKIVLTLILTGFIFSAPTFAKTEIGGVTLPDTIKVGDETLVLNGGGIREKFWLDMYVGFVPVPKRNKFPKNHRVRSANGDLHGNRFRHDYQ